MFLLNAGACTCVLNLIYVKKEDSILILLSQSMGKIIWVQSFCIKTEL